MYTHLGTNLHYIPIVISKSAHPSVHHLDILHQKSVVTTNSLHFNFILYPSLWTAILYNKKERIAV
jgi:hypothetical protein